MSVDRADWIALSDLRMKSAVGDGLSPSPDMTSLAPTAYNRAVSAAVMDTPLL